MNIFLKERDSRFPHELLSIVIPLAVVGAARGVLRQFLSDQAVMIVPTLFFKASHCFLIRRCWFWVS